MSRNNPDTLALAMDYAQTMEACAAYVAVNKPSIRTPEDAYRIVRPLIDAATGGDKQESFMVLLLNTKNKLIKPPVEATRGLLDTSPVHPREVFREAVKESAASVILAHNLCGAPHKLCYVQRRLMLSCGGYAVVCYVSRLRGCGRATILWPCRTSHNYSLESHSSTSLSRFHSGS